MIKMLIPNNFVTKLIGAKGGMVREIAKKSMGAQIKILSDRKSERELQECVVTIAGTLANRQDAACLIMEQIEKFKIGGYDFDQKVLNGPEGLDGEKSNDGSRRSRNVNDRNKRKKRHSYTSSSDSHVYRARRQRRSSSSSSNSDSRSRSRRASLKRESKKPWLDSGLIENGSKAVSPSLHPQPSPDQGLNPRAAPHPPKTPQTIPPPKKSPSPDNYPYMKNPENKMSVSPSPTKKSSEPLIDVKNAQNYRQFMTSYSKSEDCYKINNSILLNRTIGDILYEQCSKK